MADSTVSALTASDALTGTELFYADGLASAAAADVKVTATQIKTFATGSAAISGATVTASAPLINFAQTWNNAGVTFTGLKADFTSTASATASKLIDLHLDGATKFSVSKTGLVFVASGGQFSVNSVTLVGSSYIGVFTDTSPQFLLGAAGDVILNRDAANTLALRNGTTAQTFNVYNTYTDASNYEIAGLSWTLNSGFFGANVAVIGTSESGSGTNRSMAMSSGSSGGFVWATAPGQLQFGQVGVAVYWTMSAGTGHLLAGTDNTYDIGAPAATRPKNLHLGGYLAGSVQALSGAGAVNLTTWTTAFTSTGVADALTLADGVVGQIKFIVHVGDGGSGVLTPSNLFNGTIITFTNLGDSCILQFIGTEWMVISLNGAVLA